MGGSLGHRQSGNHGLEAIGVDEIQYRRGHRYLTLVYQIDAGCRRLLYVAKDRTEDSLRGFFNVTPPDVIAVGHSVRQADQRGPYHSCL